MLADCISIVLTVVRWAFNAFTQIALDLGFFYPLVAIIGIGLIVTNIVNPMIRGELAQQGRAEPEPKQRKRSP